MKWKPDEILALRKNLSLSQRQFAERLGVKRLTIARWESGKMKPNPERLAMLEKLANDTKNVSSTENVSSNENDTKNVSSKDVSSQDVSSNPSVVNQSVSKPDENVTDQNVTDENVKSENVKSEAVDNPSVSQNSKMIRLSAGVAVSNFPQNTTLLTSLMCCPY